MHETLQIRDVLVLNKSAKLSLQLFNEFACSSPAHAQHLARKVGLIGIACTDGDFRQSSVGGASRQPQESLEAKYAIQRLEAITKCIKAPAS